MLSPEARAQLLESRARAAQTLAEGQRLADEANAIRRRLEAKPGLALWIPMLRN